MFWTSLGFIVRVGGRVRVRVGARVRNRVRDIIFISLFIIIYHYL